MALCPRRRRTRYATDLTTAQWRVLAPVLPPPAKTGRPRTVSLREVLNALF
jgi:putative transposase